MFHVDLLSGRSYSWYTKHVSSTVLNYCTIHMLMTYNFTLQLKSNTVIADKLSDIEQCVSEIKVWMKHNMLKLNDDKT